MYEKILVTLDGSELAETSLVYVAELAKKMNSEVILLTVCTPGEHMERPMRAYLEKITEELHYLDVNASPIVVKGNAAEEILYFAHKNNVGLITLSSHGSTGIIRRSLGSIANRVIDRSRIPVLLIRSKEPEVVIADKELNKILILLDGSKCSEKIIPYVTGMVKGLDEVILLRIMEPMETPHFFFSYDLLSSEREKCDEVLISRLERKARRYLSKHESDIRDKGVKVSSAWLRGWPFQTILQYAEDNSVSLIAMSTHRSSGINEWSYGSIANSIIECSSKPFLLLRQHKPALNLELFISGYSIEHMADEALAY